MLNLYKLEIFAVVVQTGSFSAAAESLLMTQPAVSQHIHDLEASLGARLFQRGRRGVSLTSAGETLYTYTREILRLLAEAENAVTDVQHLASGQITVAATPGVGVYLLPDWAQSFRQHYPNLTVTVQTGTTPQIIAGLRSGRMALGLIEGELDEGIDQEGIGVLALEVNEQFVIVGPKHPWWERDHLRLEELGGQGMVMRQRNSQTRIWLDGELQRAGVQVQVAAEFDNVESIKRAVTKGKDITILPEYAVRSELEMGLLRALPVTDRPLQRTLKLVWNQHAFFTPVTRTFLRFLTRYLPGLGQLSMQDGG
ncbi:MAG TPA: LysR family transcriptional regulator [Chloroflexi bacterium]|nr:LysR family transcriptional regulator [Chloroflexota bacterium]HHW86375.1 LysR family transcriptional regulator [Chloroflexota bacterium]